MEKLLSAYEYLLQTCGAWGIILLAALLVAFFIQFGYWVVRYGRIPSFSNAKREAEGKPPVSVCLVFREVNYGFIDDVLPLLLSQDYTDFEIITIDLTGDVDFGEALTLIAENNPKFFVTKMVRDPRFPISDKMALNVAIKASRYDNILITTPDSEPVSSQWLGRMARGFTASEIVIGYCGMDHKRGFANKMIRMGRVGHSVRWLSAAMRGRPYRGTIQNIGFSKKLYFDNGGFTHLNMNLGEDDLFIQKLALAADAAVVVTANSMMKQKVWGGLRWWYADRKFHSNTFSHYTPKAKRYIATELWSRFLFFVLVAVTAITLPFEFMLGVLTLLLIRFVLVLFEMHRICKRLSEKGLFFAFIIYDIVSPVYEAWMAIDRKFRKTPGVWR